MDKVVKLTSLLGVAIIVASLVSILGVTPSDGLPGQLVMKEQAPLAYEQEFKWENAYNVYVEMGKEVEIEVLNNSQAYFESCQNTLEYCNYYEGQTGPIEGFQYIGEIFIENSGIYEVNFTVIGADSAEVMILTNGGGDSASGGLLGILGGILLICVPIFITSRFGKEEPNHSSQEVRTKTDYSLLSNEADNLEERFKKYEKSDNYNSRLIWDEGMVKIIVSENNSLLRAVAFLLVGVICIPITVTVPLPGSGFAAFFGFVFFLVGLAGLRGKQTLLIHENHLEVRFDRMNFGGTGMENPNCNSTEIKREDVTAIKYCAATIEHERVTHHDHTNSFNEADYGTSTTTTTYEETDNTRIFLALTDEMKEYGMDEEENPWFDIRSKTKNEAEELADALNFLILINSVTVKTEVEKAFTPNAENFGMKFSHGLE